MENKEQYLVINLETNWYMISLNVKEPRFDPDITKAIKFDTIKQAESETNILNSFLNKPVYGVIRYIPAEKDNLKNLSDQLNGVKPVNYQIITVNIQDPDIIKFSHQCTELIKRLNPETIHQYNLSTVPVPVAGGGIALSNICICQYWGTDEEVKEYKEELKRKNLFIKP